MKRLITLSFVLVFGLFSGILYSQNKSEEKAQVNVDFKGYGPAKSAEEFLNNAERFLNEVLLKVTDPDQLKTYSEVMDIIDADYKKYKETYNEYQKMRSEKLRKVTKAAIAKWDKKEEPVVDEDEEEIVQGKYGPSGSVDEFIKNIERFQNEVVLRLTSIHQVKNYEPEMKILDKDYERYEESFDNDQKEYLDEIKDCVRNKLMELREKSEASGK